MDEKYAALPCFRAYAGSASFRAVGLDRNWLDPGLFDKPVVLSERYRAFACLKSVSAGWGPIVSTLAGRAMRGIGNGTR